MESRISVKCCKGLNKVRHPTTRVVCLRVYTYTFYVYFEPKLTILISYLGSVKLNVENITLNFT